MSAILRPQVDKDDLIKQHDWITKEKHKSTDVALKFPQ